MDSCQSNYFQTKLILNDNNLVVQAQST